MPSIAKVVGKKRPNLQEPSGYATASTTKWDGDDAIGQTRMDKGTDTAYAIPRDVINADLRDPNGSAKIRLTGDEFVFIKESYLALIEDATAAIGTSPMTNNNTVTFTEDTTNDETPQYLKTVGNFVAASSQYLSLPTDSTVEVGTGSFTASIKFKGTTLAGNVDLFNYGDTAVSEQYYRMYMTAAGLIRCSIDDGTNQAVITDTGRDYLDGKWHTATMVVDRTLNFMYLTVDGELRNSGAGADISAVTLTLDNVGQLLKIGAGNSSGITNYFNGQLSDFHLTLAADYNLPALLEMGTRAASVTTETAAAVSTLAAGAARLNNNFIFGGDDADYIQTVIDVEDGEYDIIEVYETDANLGKVELYIDDFLIRAAVDQQNGSAVYDNKTTTLGVKMTQGRHVLKLKLNGTTGTDYDASFQWIDIIKRAGHEKGGIDEFLILGDEINQRQNAAWAFADDSAHFYSNQFSENTTGDWTEGDLFLRGGKWKIDVSARVFTDRGQFDLDIGNAEVFDKQSTEGSASNETFTSIVNISQGKNAVRLAINGTVGTDDILEIMAIRGVRLSD